MKCLVCDEDVIEDKIMVGLDIPYFNLWLHKACFRQIKNELNEFLQKNKEKLYNIIVEQNKIKNYEIKRKGKL